MVQISCQRWGEVPGLGSVDMWVLQSPGLRVEVLTLGAIIRSLSCRGKHGQMEDVVLGYDNLEGETEKLLLTLMSKTCPEYLGVNILDLSSKCCGSSPVIPFSSTIRSMTYDFQTYRGS